jgi:hypothetical protein
MDNPAKRIKMILNIDIDNTSRPIEANQVCIKKPEPDTRIKIPKFNEKRSILANIRQQVGIL